MAEFEDLDNVMSALKDEMAGIKEYIELAEDTTCPVLRKLVMDIVADEKLHAQHLLKWLNGKAQEVIS